jgi:DNA-binding LacI/PurR family transcriptional regulator
MAARYLRRLGHQTVAHITGSARHGNLSDRSAGFLAAMQPAPVVLLHGENSFHGGYETTLRLFREYRGRKPLTAIFAGNDTIAFGVLRALLDLGRKVPDEISLIGFDDVELASVVYPPLTTIHQPKYEIGKTAVEMLLRLAGEKKEHTRPERHILGVRLVERQSCKSIL